MNQNEKQERINRIISRVLGILTVICGVVLEMLYALTAIKETPWGSIFGLQVTTSRLLILSGMIMAALSFKFIYSFILRIIFRKKPGGS